MDGEKSPPMYLLYKPSDSGDGFDLLAIIGAIWAHKWLVVAISSVFLTLGIVYALLATPVYQAKAVLAPSQGERGQGLPSGLSSLAGLAGVNLTGPRDSAQALATLRSRAFVEDYIRDAELLPILFADEWNEDNGQWRGSDPEEWPDINDAIDLFVESIRTVTEDTDTGLITLAVKWRDPNLAAEWVSDLVTRINERLRARDLADSERRLQYLNSELEKARLVELRQALSRLIEDQIQTIMLAQAETEYAFTVIDPPRVPHEREWPKRFLITLAAGLLGAFVGAFSAVLLHSLSEQQLSRGS